MTKQLEGNNFVPCANGYKILPIQLLTVPRVKKRDKLFVKNGYEERYGFSQMVILLRRATRPYLAIC